MAACPIVVIPLSPTQVDAILDVAVVDEEVMIDYKEEMARRLEEAHQQAKTKSPRRGNAVPGNEESGCGCVVA